MKETSLAGSILDVVSSGFVDLTKRQREQLLVYLLHRWLVTDIHPEFDSSYIPRDFLPTAGNAMKVLFTNKKNNLIYDAACCFGKLRPDCPPDCPRMPLDRMPFGLISHNLRFFASDNGNNLEAPADYKSWYQSMYTLFGNKWAAMHNGPMWSYEDSEAEEAPSSNAPQTGDSSTSSDVLAEALHQTFGSNSELLVSKEITPAQSSATDLETCNVSEPNEENVPIGQLWTGLSESEVREREDATITLPELEELHGIRPSRQGCLTNRNRNPLNVRKLLLAPIYMYI